MDNPNYERNNEKGYPLHETEHFLILFSKKFVQQGLYDQGYPERKVSFSILFSEN